MNVYVIEKSAYPSDRYISGVAASPEAAEQHIRKTYIGVEWGPLQGPNEDGNYSITSIDRRETYSIDRFDLLA